MRLEETREELTKIDTQEKAVLYSNNLLKAFESKAEEFNKLFDRKISSGQIKSIYISATDNEIDPNKKNLYAFARISLFFDILSGTESFLTGISNYERGPSKEQTSLQFEYVDLRGIKAGCEKTRAIDFFEHKNVTDLHYSKAREDIELFDIGFCLESVENQLFITDNKKRNYLWEIL